MNNKHKDVCGFTKVNEIRNVKELSVSEEVYGEFFDRNINNIDYIKRGLIHKLLDAIFENDCYVLNKYKNFESNTEIVTISINVVDPGKRYVNLENDKFIVNGEIFTNDELIVAVKNTYPDRLI